MPAHTSSHAERVSSPFSRPRVPTPGRRLRVSDSRGWFREMSRHAPWNERSPPREVRRVRRSIFHQARVLTARYARLFVRDRRNVLILLAQIPVLALATRSTWGGVTHAAAAADRRAHSTGRHRSRDSESSADQRVDRAQARAERASAPERQDAEPARGVCAAAGLSGELRELGHQGALFGIAGRSRHSLDCVCGPGAYARTQGGLGV